MIIIVILLLIIALAVAPEAIINFCRLLDFLMLLVLKFGLLMFCFGFWAWVVWGRT